MSRYDSKLEKSSCYKDFKEELIFYERKLWSEDTKLYPKRLKYGMSFQDKVLEIINIHAEHIEKLGNKFLTLLKHYLDLNNYEKLNHDDVLMLKDSVSNTLANIFSHLKNNIQAQAAQMGIYNYCESDFSASFRIDIESKISKFNDLINIEVNKYNSTVDTRIHDNSNTFNFYGDVLNSQINNNTYKSTQYNNKTILMFDEMIETIKSDNTLTDINKNDIINNIVQTKLEINNSIPDKSFIKNKLDYLSKFSSIGNFVIKMIELLNIY